MISKEALELVRTVIDHPNGYRLAMMYGLSKEEYITIAACLRSDCWCLKIIEEPRDEGVDREQTLA